MVNSTVVCNDTGVMGANVCFNRSCHLTDAEGNVEHELPMGNYNVNISCEGYADYTGTVSVDDEHNSFSFELEELVEHDAMIMVTDSEDNPLFESNVSINDESKSTDDEGKAIFHLIDGDYTVNISKDGYKSFTGSVTVDATHTLFKFVLEEDEPVPVLRNVTVHVQSEDNTSLIGANVSIDDESKSTDNNGDCVFELYDDSYNILVQKRDYEDYTGTINVNEDSTQFNITLSLITREITLTILDNDNNPLEGVNIQIDEE